VLNWTSLYDPSIKTFNELGITDSSRKSCFKTVVFIVIIIIFFIEEHIIIIIIIIFMSMYTHALTKIILHNGKFGMERYYQKLLRCFISLGRYETGIKRSSRIQLVFCRHFIFFPLFDVRNRGSIILSCRLGHDRCAQLGVNR